MAPPTRPGAAPPLPRRAPRRGPAAILHASRQVDLFDVQTGRPYEAGIALLDVDPDITAWNAEACTADEPVIAAGGAVHDDPALASSLARVNELSGRLNDRVAAIARSFIDRGKIVGVI